MKQVDIIRETFSEAPTLDFLSQSVATAAKELLGYTVVDKSATRDFSETRLRQVLQTLGIEILNEKSVRTYQGLRLARAFAETAPGSYSWSWFSGPSWERRELTKYTKPVPDFALERAIQIKKACPEVEFWVEELVEHPDPFLIAHIGDEGYYIACWEEAAFAEEH